MTNKKTIEELYDEKISEFPENVNGVFLNNRLAGCSDLRCICKCKEYIKSWQDIYRKGECDISHWINIMPEERIQHTLSCFILGLSLYKESELIHSAIVNVPKLFETQSNQSNNTTKEVFVLT